VERVRRYLSSVSITPLGGVVLFVLLVAVALFLFGPSKTQMPGLIVAVIVMIGVVGGAPFGRWGAGAWRNPTLAGRRREFDPRARNVSDDPLSSSEEAELWRKERERRAEDHRS
jgi:prolipoprotein diacylglyceryltransferase